MREKTEVKSLRGEISPRVEHVTTYKCFLIDVGNFTPGWVTKRFKTFSKIYWYLGFHGPEMIY